ncbi:MAG TPA: hypothetical protein VE224_12850 [Pseudolabrys sp.]|nr:hypothetical protein [Pseudolabrys sp.]
MSTHDQESEPARGKPRSMPLSGAEAVELYAAEIARKIAALGEQARRLQAEVAESRQILRDIE